MPLSGQAKLEEGGASATPPHHHPTHSPSPPHRHPSEGWGLARHKATPNRRHPGPGAGVPLPSSGKGRSAGCRVKPGMTKEMREAAIGSRSCPTSYYPFAVICSLCHHGLQRGTLMRARFELPSKALAKGFFRLALCVCLLWFFAFSIWYASLRFQPCGIVLWDRIFGDLVLTRLAPSECAKTMVRVDAVGTLTLGLEVTAFVSDDRRVVGDTFRLGPNATDDALRTHFHRSTNADGWPRYRVRVRGRLFDDGKRTELVAEQITPAR